MAKQKREPTTKDHAATIEELRSRLKKAERQAERWKKKAGRYEQAHAESLARVEKLTKQRDKARRRSQDPATDPTPDAAPEAVPDVPTARTPDSSWTVAQLREEARSRGLTGLSGKSKAELVDALR